ncbi:MULTISPECIES: hypothetical protein [unclassified Bradyrhizobium]|uniref:hypothetical protein n=1 Tax=unclassified Bradyrhizobium TaxID=2631580 RepID=UPI002915DBAB|nr:MULTISPECIES: hypothetical protein [unclassified Bradyrhizobium]
MDLIISRDGCVVVIVDALGLEAVFDDREEGRVEFLLLRGEAGPCRIQSSLEVIREPLLRRGFQFFWQLVALGQKVICRQRVQVDVGERGCSDGFLIAALLLTENVAS